MDAGSFVIALLTAAGAAAGPAAVGALPDDTAPTARCIAAPGEERSGSAAERRSGPGVGLDSRLETGTGSPTFTQEQLEELAEIIGGTGSGRDTRQDTSTGSSALAEALAQELADIVAESDDPTSQRLAAALADAGFEPSGSLQETAASRSDDSGLDDPGLDDRSGRVEQRDRNRLDDQLGNGRGEQDRRSGDDLDVDRDTTGRQDETSACDAQVGEQDSGTGDSGANRSSDLEDVLSSQAAEREQAGSQRSRSSDERGGSGIAAALERGERTAE